MPYVIKFLILWSRQKPFLRLRVHNIYIHSTYIRTVYTCIYAPAVEPAALTVFMVWQLACFRNLLSLITSKYFQKSPFVDLGIYLPQIPCTVDTANQR